MNAVDSSAWLEYFDDGPNAQVFAEVIEAPGELIVPTLVLYEVYKRTCQLVGETAALGTLGVMLSGRVVDLSATIAVDAARLSMDSGLAMADAMILATARSFDATLWTQDAHFERFDNVRFVAKAN